MKPVGLYRWNTISMGGCGFTKNNICPRCRAVRISLLQQRATSHNLSFDFLS